MSYIKRKNIEKNRDILFVFGDNDERKGYGGQAKEFRGEINSLGVRTKKSPSNSPEAFYTDVEYEENCLKIREDIDNIIEESKKYVGTWITDRIGEGHADLPRKAPLTFDFLQSEFHRFAEILSKRNEKGQ